MTALAPGRHTSRSKVARQPSPSKSPYACWQQPSASAHSRLAKSTQASNTRVSAAGGLAAPLLAGVDEQATMQSATAKSDGRRRIAAQPTPISVASDQVHQTVERDYG